MPDLNLVTFGGSPWSISDLNTNFSKVKTYIETLLGTAGTALAARTTLGFTNPILDKDSPGAIGGSTPAAMTATTLTATTVNGGTVNATTGLSALTAVAGGGTIAAFSGVSGGSGRMFILSVNETAYSGAVAGMWVGRDSVTGRSINGGGTINASGADYAEYERKADGCGVVIRGQLIGFDADGKVTDRWSQVKSGFGIKTTNPNLVGGDSWGAADAIACDGELLGERPFLNPDVEHDEATVETHRADLARFESRLEAVRQRVDRISYCGKVPINVTGAGVGDYIVPGEMPDGGIGALAVRADAISFEQYRIAVGQVRRILPDGRAEVAVKVG